MTLSRVLLAANVEGDEFEGVDKGLAAFVDGKQADSEEGAKDPNDANDDPACPDKSTESVSRKTYSH